MYISKLYSNYPKIFNPILFKEGVNVIIGEIHNPGNKNKDTHNLGKSTLGKIINFSLLLKKNKDFFLFKKNNKFDNFIFFIELKINNGYLTIQRSVSNAAKISYKKHKENNQNFNDLQDRDWDHSNLPFEKAKELLDSFLDFKAIKGWSFRRQIGYLIRSQDDYKDVFKLNNFRANDAEWKPYLSKILGFDDSLINKYYANEKTIKEKNSNLKKIKMELGVNENNMSRIEGKLLIKQSEVEKKQKELNNFDFRGHDKEKIKLLVDNIDQKIAFLNKKKYKFSYEKKVIDKVLNQDKIVFNPDDAEKLFDEVGLYFPNKIKKNYEELISFNKSINEERFQYLYKEKKETEQKIKDIKKELNSLGRKRSSALSFLTSTNVFDKYKKFSNDLVELKADIKELEREREYLKKLNNIKKEITELKNEHEKLKQKIEENVSEEIHKKNGIFSRIILHFNAIIYEVISRKALLNVNVNKNGHLDFSADILDEKGNSTSEDIGHSYRKLLCVAFDLSILRAYLDCHFPHFVFHDGVFESLDDRKKQNLIRVIERYADMGVQSIIPMIDSDIPSDDNAFIKKKDIVLALNNAATLNIRPQLVSKNQGIF